MPPSADANWVLYIQQELENPQSNAFNHHKPFITRVPPPLHVVRPSAFTPQTLAIGPCHRNLVREGLYAFSFAEMEEYKVAAAKILSAQSSANIGEGGGLLEKLVQEIAMEEEEVRACFGREMGVEALGSEELGYMLALDCIFIVAFLHSLLHAGDADDEQTWWVRSSFSRVYEGRFPHPLKKAVMLDLLLLENQHSRMEAGDNRQHGREGDDEDQAQRERAKRVFERLKSVAAAMGTREMTRTTQRLSRWANPTHMQWKDVNNVSKSDVKEIWPCSEGEIKKGRWKVSKCRNEEIKAHAEIIATDVFGHTLHNGDAPLYLAKMLYMHFHLRRPVYFSSKDVVQYTVESRADTVTLTSEELALALKGAQLSLLQEKEELRGRLAAKELEAQRILQSQSPPEVNARMEERLRQMRVELQSLSQRLPSASNHLMNEVVHPEAVIPPLAASSSKANVHLAAQGF